MTTGAMAKAMECSGMKSAEGLGGWGATTLGASASARRATTFTTPLSVGNLSSPSLCSSPTDPALSNIYEPHPLLYVLRRVHIPRLFPKHRRLRVCDRPRIPATSTRQPSANDCFLCLSPHMQVAAISDFRAACTHRPASLPRSSPANISPPQRSLALQRPFQPCGRPFSREDGHKRQAQIAPAVSATSVIAPRHLPPPCLTVLGTARADCASSPCCIPGSRHS